MEQIFPLGSFHLWDCPSIDLQLAACAWAETEAARLAAEAKRAAPPPPRREPLPSANGLEPLRGLKHATNLAGGSLLSQAALTGMEMKRQLLAAHPQSWWEKQGPPPEAVTSTYVTNGVRCYETKLPPRHQVVYDAARDLHICERCWRTFTKAESYMEFGCKE